MLTLNRKELVEGLNHIAEAQLGNEESYLDSFKINFPDGVNTAATLEICRAIQDSSFESKVRLTRICIAGKVVEIVCPNGEKESFCLSNVNDNFEAFPIFVKEPLALIALSDAVYGFVLKKSVRLSKPKEAAAKNQTL